MVLAGGIGSRFWPVSTEARPKQLLALASERSLIEDTIARARSLVPDERIRILAGRHLVEPFQSVLHDLPESCYWVEPEARGTAPVLAWAASKLAAIDPDAVMVSLHADHLIDPPEAFQETVATAVTIAVRNDLLLSIGAVPDRIETGYGHIEPDAPLPPAGPARAIRVARFHEKPDAATARRYVDAGHLWNTGIFVWQAVTLLAEIEAHAPDLHASLALLERSDEAFFSAVEPCVIDKAIMERSDRVGAVVATFTWDDVGSWEALARTRSRDDDGNILLGSSQAVDSRGNIVFSDDGGTVVLFGAEDLIVVRSGDTTMVMPRSRASEMKTFLQRLDEQTT